MKDLQENFTQASKIYLSLEEEIRQMYNSKPNNIISLDNALKSFDIMVQMIYLYMAALNNDVSVLELKYIKKITIEEDILDYINCVSGKKFTWSSISSAHMTNEEYEDFLHYTNNIVEPKISSFIMLVSSIDALTKKDYYKEFVAGFKQLFKLFCGVSSNSDYDNEIDEILNTIFLAKYRSLKTIFSLNINL